MEFKHGMDVALALNSKLLRDVIDLLVAAECSWELQLKTMSHINRLANVF
jgi:hypothetical protein